jgi:hypothetical protein
MQSTDARMDSRSVDSVQDNRDATVVATNVDTQPFKGWSVLLPLLIVILSVFSVLGLVIILVRYILQQKAARSTNEVASTGKDSSTRLQSTPSSKNMHNLRTPSPKTKVDAMRQAQSVRSLFGLSATCIQEFKCLSHVLASDKSSSAHFLEALSTVTVESPSCTVSISNELCTTDVPY